MVVHPHCLSLVLQTLEVSVRAWAITLGMMLTLMLADRGSAELVPDLDPGSHEAVSLLPSLSDRASERRVDAIPEPTSLLLLGAAGGTGLALRFARDRLRNACR